MRRWVRRLAAVVAVAAVPSVAVIAVSLAAPGVFGGESARPSAPSSASAPPASVVARAGLGPARRLVWDESLGKRHGIHLRTALVRGDQARDTRAVYDTPLGFPQQLRLDGHGRRVVLAPCCRSSFPTLVVVDLASREVQEPLAAHPQFYAVGALAWSPDDSHLAFEGFTEVGGRPARGLWTVAVDGSDLRTALAPQRFDGRTSPYGTLAWSSAGLLYPDAFDLTLLAPGQDPRVLTAGVESVQLSGDGRWLFAVHSEAAGRSLWRSHPDGSDARRVDGLDGSAGRVSLLDIAPDRRGTRLLGLDGVDTTVLRTWRVGQPLTRAPVVRGVSGSPYVATWW